MEMIQNKPCLCIHASQPDTHECEHFDPERNHRIVIKCFDQCGVFYILCRPGIHPIPKYEHYEKPSGLAIHNDKVCSRHFLGTVSFLSPFRQNHIPSLTQVRKEFI